MLFAVLFARIREKGILDFIAHGSILQGFTVAWSGIIPCSVDSAEFPYTVLKTH